MRIYNSFNELPGAEGLNNQAFGPPTSILNFSPLRWAKNAIKKISPLRRTPTIRAIGESSRETNPEYKYDVKKGRTPIYGSSYLKSIGYDYDTNQMEVEFTDGAVYRYDCYPTEIDDILNAESRGQYFYYNDRLAFPYHRVRGRSY